MDGNRKLHNKHDTRQHRSHTDHRSHTNHHRNANHNTYIEIGYNLPHNENGKIDKENGNTDKGYGNTNEGYGNTPDNNEMSIGIESPKDSHPTINDINVVEQMNMTQINTNPTTGEEEII